MNCNSLEHEPFKYKNMDVCKKNNQILGDLGIDLVHPYIYVSGIYYR